MAKCIAVWNGIDSTNRQIEVALSVDNAYFFRVYQFNGYQNAWSKWQHLETEEVKHAVSYRNAYNGEVYFYNEDKTPSFDIIEWGFCTLKGGKVEGCRYRLPNL